MEDTDRGSLRVFKTRELTEVMPMLSNYLTEQIVKTAKRGFRPEELSKLSRLGLNDSDYQTPTRPATVDKVAPRELKLIEKMLAQKRKTHHPVMPVKP